MVNDKIRNKSLKRKRKREWLKPKEIIKEEVGKKKQLFLYNHPKKEKIIIKKDIKILQSEHDLLNYKYNRLNIFIQNT